MGCSGSNLKLASFHLVSFQIYRRILKLDADVGPTRHLNGCLSSPTAIPALARLRFPATPLVQHIDTANLKPLAFFMSMSTTASTSVVAVVSSRPARRYYKVVVGMDVDNSEQQSPPAQTLQASATAESAAADVCGFISHCEDDASRGSSGVQASPASEESSSAASSGGGRYRKDAAPSGTSTHASTSSSLNAPSSSTSGLSFTHLTLFGL